MGDLILFGHNLTEWKKTFSTAEASSPTVSGNATKILLGTSPSTTSSRECSSPESSDAFVTLSEILNETPSASVLTEFYDEKSKFLDDHRQLLVNVVCSYFQQNNFHMSLATSYRLEDEILERFPTEKHEYYRTGKRGKIYSKFCNAKNTFKSIKRSLNSTVSNEEPCKRVAKVLSPESDATDCVRSLKFDNLSAAEFDRCWQACSQYRLNEIMHNTTSLSEIFNKWPEYKKPSGYRLIDKDFSVVFGSRTEVLGDWENNFRRGISI